MKGCLVLWPSLLLLNRLVLNCWHVQMRGADYFEGGGVDQLHILIHAHAILLYYVEDATASWVATKCNDPCSDGLFF